MIEAVFKIILEKQCILVISENPINHLGFCKKMLDLTLLKVE